MKSSDGQNSAWLIVRGDSLLEVGKVRGARAAYIKVLEVEPHNIEALSRLSFIDEIENPNPWRLLSNPIIGVLYCLVTWPLLLLSLPFWPILAVRFELKNSGFIDKSGKFAFHDRDVRQNSRFSHGYWTKTPDSRNRVQGATFVDTCGASAFKSTFANAESFSEGFAAIQVGASWGFIDVNGDLSIEPCFQDVGSFNSGVAAARVGEKWGFINTAGEWVIEPVFESVLPFSDGLAAVSSHGKIGFINITGEVVLEAEFDEASRFSEGLSRVVTYASKRTHHVKYINRNGDTVIDWNALLVSLGTTGGVRGFVDQNVTSTQMSTTYLFAGKSVGRNSMTTIVGSSPDRDCHFHNGLVPVWVRGKYGYINRFGELAIPLVFDSASPFSEGLALVSIRLPIAADFGVGVSKERYGFIDTRGNFAIAPVYASACNFSDGVARVELRSKHKVGFIDKAGKVLFEMKKIGLIGKFQEGFVPVESWPFCNL